MSSRGSRGSRPADRGAGELTVFIADHEKHTGVLGKKRRLVVRSWDSLATVKRTLATRLHIPTAQQRLFFRDKELKNNHSLQDAGVCRSGETLTLAIAPLGGLSAACVSLEAVSCPRALQHALWQAKRAFLLGQAPHLALDGTGGCYFFPDPRGVAVAVFKPSDEEAFCANNPRGPAYCTVGGVMRAGVAPGQSHLREVCAYRLDTGHFAEVPPTGLVRCGHPKLNYLDASVSSPAPKLGSLQAFVPASVGAAEDFSPARFSAAEVHKIAIFDLRVLNCDRNAGNLLVVPRGDGGGLSLVPIDHGLSFPDALSVGYLDWCWLDWPQCKEPLDAATQSFVLDVVDPDADFDLVLKCGLPVACATLVKLAGLLLQLGCRAHLTLHAVACLVARDDVDGDGQRSPLEMLHAEATALAAEGLREGRAQPARAEAAPPAAVRSPSPERGGFWVHEIADVASREAGDDTAWDEGGAKAPSGQDGGGGEAFYAAFWAHAGRLLRDLVRAEVDK